MTSEPISKEREKLAQSLANNEQDGQARIKVMRLFRYIQAFNQLQNPVQKRIEDYAWQLWLHDLPVHPYVRRGDAADSYDNSVEIEARTAQASSGEDIDNIDALILRVRRPELRPAPEPPAAILPWLQGDWQSIDGQVTINQSVVPDFSDDAGRVRLLQEWQRKREAWIKAELPAHRALELFQYLYDLRTVLERETEQWEIVVGDGILHWSPLPAMTIYHPILLQRLQLRFDASIPEFSLVGTDQPPELYTMLFQALPGVEAVDLRHIRQEFEQQPCSPLEEHATTEFLQRFVHQLSSRGQFSAQPVLAKDDAVPLITRDPVIFLRKRILGFHTALEAVLEDIAQSDEHPYALTSLVGITIDQPSQVTDDERNVWLASPNGEDETILLSKPANAEQLEIARHLERDKVVLVQGPPGTGKTHTIANLLGYLLAQGKSVLVTSHTSKALRVLHEKVVAPLQPLCVSSLEDEDRKQMERAIDAIAEKISSANPAVLEREAASLRQQRLELLRQLRSTRDQLKAARSSEYLPIVIAGESYTPSEAARYVAVHAERDAWLPAPVELGSACPLSENEIRELYHTNITVTPADEREMVAGLPDPKSLLTPTDIERLVSERQQMEQTERNFRADLWVRNGPPPHVEFLQDVLARCAQAIAALDSVTTWQMAAIDAGRKGGLYLKVWYDLVAKIKAVNDLAAQAEPLLLEYDPFIPDQCFPEQRERILSEILKRAESSKKLAGYHFLLHRDWKVLVEQCRVQGREPVTKEHFEALLIYARLCRARQELCERWQRQMTIAGAPAATQLGATPERVANMYVQQLSQYLEWYTGVWQPLEQQLLACGLQWHQLLATVPPIHEEYGELRQLITAVRFHLPRVVQSEVARLRYSKNEDTFRQVQRCFDVLSSEAQRTQIVQRLRQAVIAHDALQYREAYMRLKEIHERQRDRQRRYELLAKLERVAPGWAYAIRQREGQHGLGIMPERVEEAWRWRQLHDELERRGSIPLEELQERITRLTAELHTVTANLVERQAWAAQIRRTTPRQQQALMGWKETMRKVGKGKGKRAAHLLAEARRLMPECQTAVPVWIMPLSRVVQNFDPRRNRFDVVIIDEASQADIKALIAVYMGRQVVIVGDHEQVTPTAVGQRIDELEKLISEHLLAIPNAHLYDGKLSIYSLAQTTFPPICLREHFRCVSPIIQFSNALSYAGKIKPLRDDSEVKRRPPLIAYRVQSASLTGNVNEEEAQTVASLLVAAIEQPEYTDASFGVISMVGDAQALRIEALLRTYLTPAIYTQHRILCGNPSHFQGDERDVMFLSMVDVPDSHGPLSLRSDDANDFMYRKRFNVAASRARDQMWVVYSLDPDTDLKPGDIRRRLILHAKNAGVFQQKFEREEQKVDSEFERLVLHRLMQAGYRVTAQWPVGAYRIDLVVEGDGKRLAVECDGDRWHPLEKLEEDMARQAILERLGWRFVRIRGSLFFRNPDLAMRPVFEKLQALNIPPEGQLATAIVQPAAETLLKDRIIKRAQELRDSWRDQNDRRVISLSTRSSARLSTVSKTVFGQNKSVYRKEM